MNKLKIDYFKILNSILKNKKIKTYKKWIVDYKIEGVEI